MSEQSQRNIDFSYLKDLSGDNKDFEKEIINMFLLQIDEDSTLIEDAIQKKDFKNLSLYVHKLKGSFRMFGAKGVEELQQIETASKDESKPMDLLENEWNDFKKTLEQTKKELNIELNLPNIE